MAPASDKADVLVGRLRDLHEGPRVLPEVIALGEAAIPALETLLRAPSEGIPHRRWLAADALGAIGTVMATATLARALRDSSSRNLDPVARDAEDQIVNRIAQNLDRGRDPEVTDALLEALSRRPCASCARSLGRRADPRAIPQLILCLYEDTTRIAAMEALRRFEQSAATPLAVAVAGKSHGVSETPSHVDGRAAAATLLGALKGPDGERSLLRALTDRQPSVRLAAALALAGHREFAARPAVSRQVASALVTALGDADWAQASAIVQGLVRLGRRAERSVVAAIAQEPRCGADRLRRVRAVAVATRLSLESAVPVLAHLHGASDAHLRLAAVAALVRQHPPDPSLLGGFVSDPVAVIRRKAAEALCADNMLTVAQTVPLLGDPDAGMRALAQRGLRRRGTAASLALARASLSLGAPLHGWARWRLWSNAARLWIELALLTPTRASRQRLHIRT